MSKADNSTLKPVKKKSHPFWRWFWLTFLVVSLAYAWYSFYAPPNSINWESDITTHEELSNNDGKNTLLFFTGKWCSPCQIMKRQVFADEEVEDIVNSKFKAVMIDIDNPKTNELVAYFEVGVTPTTIILDSQGDILDYATRKMSKAEFLEMLGNTE